MKATINGITIDGTPAEIAEYQRLMELKMKPMVQYMPPLYKSPTDATGKGKCPNEGHACFCTGACTSNGATTNARPMVFVGRSYNEMHNDTEK